MVLRLYEAGAPLFVATRIGELATAGDMAGVRRWQEIASRMDKLMNPRQPS